MLPTVRSDVRRQATDNRSLLKMGRIVPWAGRSVILSGGGAATIEEMSWSANSNLSELTLLSPEVRGVFIPWSSPFRVRYRAIIFVTAANKYTDSYRGLSSISFHVRAARMLRSD